MLKAAIVYVQGSGGNLLTRTMTLCKKTVPLVPQHLAKQQATLDLAIHDRFHYNNNWNNNNWTYTEKSLSIWYKQGFTNFVQYESSDLWLIDSFHPHAFEWETNRKLLWEDITAWPYVIFIKFQNDSLPSIIKNATIKRPDLMHSTQIKNNELAAYNRLLVSMPSALAIWWEDMLHLDSYVSAVQQLCVVIDLKIDIDLVQKLWVCWNAETNLLLNKTT